MPDTRDVPILFSAPMVRAIMAGTKTETRRVLKPQPEERLWEIIKRHPHQEGMTRWCVGDRLWVRETFAKVGDNPRENDDEFMRCFDLQMPVYYRADDVQSEISKWRPSIFMPRIASRISLEVTEVRIERLWEIDEVGAIAEGMAAIGDTSAVAFYADLWNQINGPRAWDANPWVSVTRFKRIANA